jgi:hypothetical protein
MFPVPDEDDMGMRDGGQSLIQWIVCEKKLQGSYSFQMIIESMCNC